MAESFFDRLQVQAFRAGIQIRTDDSMDWFRDKLRNMRNINRQQLIKDERLERVTRPRMGDMYMFFYDPKFKETLNSKESKDKRSRLKEGPRDLVNPEDVEVGKP